MTPEDIERRRTSKRFNERLKLTATFLSNGGIATLVGAAVVPNLMNAPATPDPDRITVIALCALALHLAGQAVLTFIRSED